MRTKNLFMFTCLIAILISITLVLNTQSVNINFTNHIEKFIKPRFNITTNTYITTDGWSTFATDNNIFSKNLKVTNDSNNPDDIIIRVVNSDGKIIIESATVSLGTTVNIGKVPFNSGTYSIQAKPNNKSGIYKLNATYLKSN